MHYPSPDSSASLASNLSRREALATFSAAALWTLGLWPGALRAANKTPSGPAFTFVVVNDTHYLSPECGRWLERVVERMREERPAFCLHLGDLVERCTRANLAAVREAFSQLDAPVHFQIGNHDYGGGDNRSAYEELFPGQLNYHFAHQGWQFVGLDSTDGQRWEKTAISEGTLRWLDEHLPALDREKPTALFTHFPLGEGVAFRPSNADAVLERLRDHNLQAIWSGHFHGHTTRIHGQAALTTSRCCALRRDNHDGTPDKGFLVCTAHAGRVGQRFVAVPTP